ncbi:prephenate dehydratase [Thermoplasmatales archaeon AK]|nr:prephenate dehydratase [Thermoplasmatales archaeon AK]
MRIAYLGPEGTWSWHAARISYPGSSLVAAKSFTDAIMMVESDQADCCMLPVENSVEGPVPEVLDLLLSTPLLIIAEKMICIKNSLLSYSDHVKRIYSHHQALAQCRGKIRRYFPNAEVVEVNSTASMASSISAGSGDAIIGSRDLASLYGLKVIIENLNDYPVNVTRFITLGNAKIGRIGGNKTTISFLLTSDAPGSLVEALSLFARRGINLSMVISRPEKSDPGSYRFFIDAEGDISDPPMAEAMNGLKRLCRDITIKGSYPKASWKKPDGC